MKKLHLPIVKGVDFKPKILSMDEYLKFVQFNLKHCFDKKAHTQWKRISVVNVPFVIK